MSSCASVTRSPTLSVSSCQGCAHHVIHGAEGVRSLLSGASRPAYASIRGMTWPPLRTSEPKWRPESGNIPSINFSPAPSCPPGSLSIESQTQSIPFPFFHPDLGPIIGPFQNPRTPVEPRRIKLGPTCLLQRCSFPSKNPSGNTGSQVSGLVPIPQGGSSSGTQESTKTDIWYRTTLESFS